MEGYVLWFSVVILFIVFSILQIKEGRDNIQNSKGLIWYNKLRILFAIIILMWAVFFDSFFPGLYLVLQSTIGNIAPLQFG